MKKRKMNSWYKRILAFSLAFMMMLQPAMVSVAAEPQPSTEVEISDSSVESTEDASTEEAVTDESATEEDVTEEATEAISEEVVSEEISEETVSEEVSTEEAVSEDSSEETASEEIVDDNSINSTSTDADFVIEAGVLTSYTGTATDVIIPSGVTTIGEGVFRENDTVVSVTFPETLTTIEAYAFRDCENLQTVTVNEKLVTIGKYAFYQCKNLKSFTCPSTVKTIGDYAFYKCTNLFSITLNEGLESIGDHSFVDAALGGLDETKVTVYGTLTIPSTVSFIGYNAFESCEYLGEVVFANGTTEAITFDVDWEVSKLFYGCKNLKKVTFPERATNIPSNAFLDCTALEEISVGSKLISIDTKAFDQCKNLKSFNCPSTVKTIGGYAFRDCTSLFELTLNEGLTTIGDYAFNNAAIGGLNENKATVYGTLTIPSTVSSIGYSAFASSDYLGEVIFADGTTAGLEFVTDWDVSKVFYECKNLKKVTFPERATNIPSNAFLDCTALEEISVGSKLTSIDTKAFDQCKNLKSFTCPSSVKTIGEYAFRDCTSLFEITLNEGLTTIGNYAFNNAAIGGLNENKATVYGTLTIPSTVSSIGCYAFESSDYLGEVIFADGTTTGLTFVEDYGTSKVFCDCKNLKKVTLPERATNIPGRAFQDCVLLEEVICGSKLEAIGNYAFNQCKSLKSFTCPSSLRSIGDFSFASCTSLMSIDLNEGLETIGNNAFNNAALGGLDENKTTVYGTLTIPATVYSIGCYAFESSAYLGEVIFANGTTQSLTFVEDYGTSKVFYNCKNLKKVTLPERATAIPGRAFQSCTALEEVNLGKNIKTIGNYAFDQCKSLKYFTCPASLTAIGDYSFAACSSLMNITLNEGLETIGNYAFTNTAFGGKDENKKQVYGSLTIPTTVYSIGTYAFSGCTYLEEVIFPDGTTASLTFVNSYGSANTFQDCKELKRVYLPERLTEMPGYLFQRCNALDTLYIPNGVSSIAENVFGNTDTTNLVIYCEEGSVARIFAKTHGYNYKDKSELGIYVKSLKLNREQIYFAGETAIGKEITLKTTVSPATALNKVVTYKSTNEAVATVDTTGIVTIKGYGEADIIVTSLENSEITATCHVEIIRQWNSAELAEIREYIIANNELEVLTNVYRNLQELKITAPDGIAAEWKVPYEIETGVHTYDVSLSKEGYQTMVLEDVPVSGITVTDVKIFGLDEVQAGKSFDASVVIITEGGSISPEDYQLEWKSSNASNVKVAASVMNPLAASVTGLKVSKGTFVSVTFVLNKDGNAVSVEKADLGKTWFNPGLKVTVSGYNVVDDIQFDATQNGTSVDLQDLAELVNLEGTVSYELNAVAFGYGEVVSDASLTWKSTNTKVATVKADKSGKVTLNVLGKGTAYISATASKNGGYTEYIKVTVLDSRPRLSEKDVTINGYLIDASVPITMLPSDGFEINDDSLSVVDAKKGTETSFEVKYTDDTYVIRIKDGATVKKGTYSVKILVKTDAEEEKSHELPLKIKVVEVAPKVSFDMEEYYLFAESTFSTISVITDAEINDISYTPSVGIGKPRLVEFMKEPSDGLLYVEAENINASNYTKTSNKGTIRIVFEGYVEAATYEKKITLPVVKKLPVVKAVPSSATLYPETLCDTAEVVFYAEQYEVRPEQGYTFSVKEQNGYQISNLNGSGSPTIQALKNAKSGKITFTLTSEHWHDGLSVTSVCNIKIGKAPQLSFGVKTLTLNTAYSVGAYDYVTVDAFVNGFEDITFNDAKLQVKGKDEKAQTVLDDGALDIYMEDGEVKAGIVDSGYFKKAGSYTYIITAYSEDNMPVTGTLKVTVALAKSKASVSFKTKGSINILDREGTSVVVTPVVKNYTGTVEDVELYGASAGKFEAEIEGGNIVIKALPDRALKSGGAYQLGVYVTLDSGVSLENTVKIVPKQKNPKLTQSTKSVVLFETAKGVVFGEEISIDVAAKQAGTIKSIALASESDTFGYIEGSDGTGILYVKDSASLVAGKKYTVKLAVTFEDDAINAKPSYVSVSIDYRK